MTSLTMWLLLGTFVAVNCGDLSGSALTRLYNTGVQFAEWVTRPKQLMPSWVPEWCVTTHSGVLVTLVDGQKFLIHKGPGFGVASETVVTDIAHMSDRWEVKETRYFAGTKTVGDFVQTGGENYSILKGQHCHTAAKDMMNQGKK
uniref:Uncharacterized protein n=1 Tax=Neogobius melanostomus TaxID=47308 RepID=A0A8C6UXJ2_9GOBI